VSVSESGRDARVAPRELLPRPPGTRSGAVLRPTDNRRRRGAELLRMRYPIRLAREDRAGGGDVSEARGRGLQPYRAQHRRTAVPPRVKSRIPSSTRQSLVRARTSSYELVGQEWLAAQRHSGRLQAPWSRSIDLRPLGVRLHQPKSRLYAAKALSAERPQQSAVVAYSRDFG
jgi:hypothetical protein